MTRAIKILRERETIVIVISHRPSALAALDSVLVLHNGEVLAFGQRDEVWARFANRNADEAGCAHSASGSRTSLESKQA